MTEQYPSNPAFPGPDYRPHQAPHQPGGVPSDQGQPPGYAHPHDMQWPQPYGQPYGQQAPQPYGQLYGQQVLQPYGPVYGLVPQKPSRPGNVTAASVLGIVSGGLGIFVGIFAITFTSGFHSLVTAFGTSSGLSVLLVLSYVEAFGTFITAVALLASGITFFKGKGGTVLLISAVSQAAMAMLFLMILLLIPQLLDFGSLPSRGIQSVPSGINGLTLFAATVGLGLAGSIIGLLFSPTVRSWQR